MSSGVAVEGEGFLWGGGEGVFDTVAAGRLVEEWVVIGEDFFMLHGGVFVGNGYVGVAVWDKGFFNSMAAAGATRVRRLLNCESVVDRSFFASSRFAAAGFSKEVCCFSVPP